MNIKDIDTFTRHYLIAALWSSHVSADDDAGTFLEENYGLDDIHPDTVAEAYDDCQDFQQDHDSLLIVAYAFYRESGMANHPDAGSPEACAGHDFWLSRNGHGCGFFDRGMGKVGDYLQAAAKVYSGVDLYVGDDGKVHS